MDIAFSFLVYHGVSEELLVIPSRMEVIDVKRAFAYEEDEPVAWSFKFEISSHVSSPLKVC